MISIFTYAIGFVSGMYVCTQLEKGIDKNVNSKKTIQKNIHN